MTAGGNGGSSDGGGAVGGVLVGGISAANTGTAAATHIAAAAANSAPETPLDKAFMATLYSCRPSFAIGTSVSSLTAFSVNSTFEDMSEPSPFRERVG
jgi:hypothetical protein